MFEDIFAQLAQSDFRRRFKLSAKDKAYALEKGADIIRKHAEDFIASRLAPAYIPNDGKQTPMRNHPVFTAQHATACCCRECLQKWHKIPAGKELNREEQKFMVDLIMAWIGKQLQN